MTDPVRHRKHWCAQAPRPPRNFTQLSRLGWELGSKSLVSQSQRTTLQHPRSSSPLSERAAAVRPSRWVIQHLCPRKKRAAGASPCRLPKPHRRRPLSPGHPQDDDPNAPPRWGTAGLWRSQQRLRLQSSSDAPNGPAKPAVRTVDLRCQQARSSHTSVPGHLNRSYPSGPAKRKSAHLPGPPPAPYCLRARNFPYSLSDATSGESPNTRITQSWADLWRKGWPGREEGFRARGAGPVVKCRERHSQRPFWVWAAKAL